MSRDNLQSYGAGDSLRTFSASGYNTLVNGEKQRRAERQSGPDFQPAPELRNGGLVYVRNTSGADVPQYGVLGIDTILFSPTDNLGEFKNRPCLTGVTPAAEHAGKFVVLAEPLAKGPDDAPTEGKIGRAFIDGICVVQVDFLTATDPCADVKPTSNVSLAGGGSGAARILYKESGTGVKWALVRLGTTGLPPGTGIWRVLTLIDDLDPGTPDWDDWRFRE